jgi:hypothetical protein
MRCPSCSYIFSEELRTCPRCGADVGAELEKLGYFPQPAKEPFLFIEDFQKTPTYEEPAKGQTEVEKPQKREIEINFQELSNEMKDIS